MTERRLSDRIKALHGWEIKQISSTVWYVYAPGHPDDPFIYENGEWINEEFEGELVSLVQDYEWMTGVAKKHYGVKS